MEKEGENVTLTSSKRTRSRSSYQEKMNSCSTPTSSRDIMKSIFSQDSVLKTNVLLEKALSSQRSKLTTNVDNPVDSNDSFEFKDQPKFRKGKGKLKLKSLDKGDEGSGENAKQKIEGKAEQLPQEAKSSNDGSNKSTECTGRAPSHESNSFADFEPFKHKKLCDENQDNSTKPETKGDLGTASNIADNSSCKICHSNVSKSELEEHQRSCLRDKFTKQSDAQPLPSSEKQKYCEICKQNIGNLNSRAQSKHMNECLDKVEKAEQDEKEFQKLLVEARSAVLACPLCGQNFKTQQSRKGHLKKCAKDKGMAVDQVKVLIKQQEETYAAQLDAGILPEEFKKRKTGGQAAEIGSKKPKSKKILDEDTQLALALSNSLMSDDNRPDENFHQPVMPSESRAVEEQPEGPSIVHSLLQDEKQKTTTKGKKGKQCESTYPLQALSREAAAQRISDRVDKSIFTPVETSANAKTPPFKKSSKLSSSVHVPWVTTSSVAEVEENDTEEINGGNCLWLKTGYSKLKSDPQAEASSPGPSGNSWSTNDNVTTEARDSMAGKKYRLEYYVKRLMPPVRLCKVATGSKVKCVSTISGRRKSGNTENSNWNPEPPADLSEGPRPPTYPKSPIVEPDICPSQTVQDLAQLAMESDDTIATAAVNARSEDGLNEVEEGSRLDVSNTSNSTGEHNIDNSQNEGQSHLNLSLNYSSCATENECGPSTNQSPLSYSCMVINSLYSDVVILASENSCSEIQGSSSNSVQTKTMRAHKVILHVQCPKFLSLCVSSPEGDHIDLTDCSEQAVLSLLTFLYTGGLGNTLVPECKDQVLKLAQRFSLNRLEQEVLAVCHQDYAIKKEPDSILYSANNISSPIPRATSTAENNSEVKVDVESDVEYYSVLDGPGTSSSTDVEMQVVDDIKKEETESQSTLPDSQPQSVVSEKLDEYMTVIAHRARSEESEQRENQFEANANNISDGRDINGAPSEKAVESENQDQGPHNSQQVTSTPSVCEGQNCDGNDMSNLTASDINSTIPVSNLTSLQTPITSRKKKKVSREDFKQAVQNVSSVQDNETEAENDSFNKIVLKIEQTMPRSSSPVFIPSVLEVEPVGSDELLITSANIVSPPKKRVQNKTKKDAGAGGKNSSPRGKGCKDKKPLQPQQKGNSPNKYVQASPQLNVQQNDGSHALPVSGGFREGNPDLLQNPVLSSVNTTSSFSTPTNLDLSSEDLFAESPPLDHSSADILKQTDCNSSNVAGSTVFSTLMKSSLCTYSNTGNAIKGTEIQSGATSLKIDLDKADSSILFKPQTPKFESKFGDFTNLKNSGEKQFTPRPFIHQSQPSKFDDNNPQFVQLSPPSSQKGNRTRRGCCKKDSPHFKLKYGTKTSETDSNTSLMNIKMGKSDSTITSMSQPSEFGSMANECTNLKNTGKNQSNVTPQKSPLVFQSQPNTLDSGSSPEFNNTTKEISNVHLSPPSSQIGKNRTRRGLSKKDSPLFKAVYKSGTGESASKESDHSYTLNYLSSHVMHNEGEDPAQSTPLDESHLTNSLCGKIDPAHPSRRKLDMEMIGSNQIDSPSQMVEMENSPLPLRERLKMKVTFDCQPVSHIDSKSSKVNDPHTWQFGKPVVSKTQIESETRNGSIVKSDGLSRTYQSGQMEKSDIVPLKVSSDTMKDQNGENDNNLLDRLSSYVENNSLDGNRGIDAADDDDSFSGIIDELERCEQEFEEVLTPQHSNCDETNRQARSEWKEPSPFTPMAPYDSMPTPALKRAVEKIGVRPLGKKRMRELLKSVYNETHQYETDSDYEPTPVKHPRVEKPSGAMAHCSETRFNQNGVCKALDTNMSNLPSSSLPANLLSVPSNSQLGNNDPDNQIQESEDLPLSQNSSGSDAPDLPEESILQGWPEEEEENTATQMTQTSEETVAEKLVQFVLSNNDIYEEILMYKPLELDVLKKRISDAGIRVSIPKVMDFLDERCITFTMKNMSSRNNRNQKQSKKKSNQVGKKGKES